MKKERNIDFIPQEIISEYPEVYSFDNKPDEESGQYINYTPEKDLKDNLEIYELSGWNFSNLPEHLKRDEEYLIHAAQKDYTSIKNIIDWFELEFYKEENTKYK